MELIALGTYGPYPKEGTATSGYLLSVEGASYLFDMGSGVYARLVETLKDLDTLRGVFLTHLHFDHISDISVFKYAVNFKKERGLISKTPQLYHPKTPEATANSLIHGETFVHHFIDANFVYQDEHVRIQFVPMHHPVETYGVRVESQGKVFVYTSDTAYFEGLSDFIKDADLLIINCGYLDKDKPQNPNHLSSGEVAELVQKGNVKRALATHLFAENERHVHETEIQTYGLPELSLIEEMKVYTLIPL